MSEAKYKVGDEVVYGSAKAVVKTVGIVQVEIPNGALMYAHEDRLTPYVSPLAVGDRVQRKSDHRAGGILRHIEGGEACYFSSFGSGLVVCDLSELERIPTEAGK